MNHTSIEQSKKLIALGIDTKSADMWWDETERFPRFFKHYHEYLSQSIPPIPCWSVGALLGVLPNGIGLFKTVDGEFYCLSNDYMTKNYDNSIDACVAMIEKLHELKML